MDKGPLRWDEEPPRTLWFVLLCLLLASGVFRTMQDAMLRGFSPSEGPFLMLTLVRVGFPILLLVYLVRVDLMGIRWHRLTFPSSGPPWQAAAPGEEHPLFKQLEAAVPVLERYSRNRRTQGDRVNYIVHGDRLTDVQVTHSIKTSSFLVRLSPRAIRRMTPDEVLAIERFFHA